MKSRYLLIGLVLIAISVTLTIMVMQAGQVLIKCPVHCPVVMTLPEDMVVYACHTPGATDCTVMTTYHAFTWVEIYGDPVMADGKLWHSVSPLDDLWIMFED